MDYSEDFNYGNDNNEDDAYDYMTMAMWNTVLM